MPTVYLPLGSQAASGKMGDMFVYQGTSVRSFVTPTDPRSGAQLDVRHLFYDITKMVKSAGSWARAAWLSNYGSRWFTLLYRQCKLDPWGGWAVGEGYWGSYSVEEQAYLNQVAPFLATYNEPGRIWLCLLRVLYADLENQVTEDFGFGDWLFGNIDQAVVWWSKDLNSALQSGTFGSDHVSLVYNFRWSSVEDELAYQGKYHLSESGVFCDCTVYFYGTRVTVGFVSDSSFGSVAGFFDSGETATFTEFAAGRAYGNQFAFPVVKKGLHRLVLTSWGQEAWTLEYLIISGKVSKSSIPKVVGATYSIGVLEMSQQTVTPALPDAGKEKLYFLESGQLQAVGHDGVPVSYVPDAITQADGDVRYLQSVPQQDHGGLAGLGDDDHTQYYNQTRGDVRYLQSVPQQDHGGLSGLGDDDHTQYYNQTRGDVRYLRSVPKQDHGGLAGLGDDDHTQYYNQTRGDARYSQTGHTHLSIDSIGAYLNAGTIAAGATGYGLPFGFGVLGGGNFPWPCAGTLKSLFVRIGSTQPASGSLVATLEKNNSATALVVTIPAGSTSNNFSDLAHTVTVVAGDNLRWSIKNNATGTSAAISGIVMLIECVTA